MGGNCLVVFSEIVACLSGKVEELATDYMEQTAEQEVGVDSSHRQHPLAQFFYMEVPHLLNLIQHTPYG